MHENLFERLPLPRPPSVLTDIPVFVNDKELSRITGISRRTFQNWRSRGGGPPIVHAGRSVRYELAAVIYWMRQNGRAVGASA